MKKLLFLTLGILSTSSFAFIGDISAGELQSNKNYCQSTGGTVIMMTAQFDTPFGYENGVTKEFCQYNNHGNIADIGLETLSTTPTVAATYTKKLIIDKTKSLPLLPYDNPSLNVCSKLHGSEIAFASFDGGFADKLGQSDICIFGDGSSISAWTIIYSAIGSRTDIKRFIRSKPLHIDIPNVQ